MTADNSAKRAKLERELVTMMVSWRCGTIEWRFVLHAIDALIDFEKQQGVLL